MKEEEMQKINAQMESDFTNKIRNDKLLKITTLEEINTMSKSLRD